jgi:hypothetical protein
VLTRTPFIAIESNTRKIRSLLEDIFGNEDRILNLEAVADGSLIKAVERRTQFTPEEVVAIECYLDKARNAADMMFQEIAIHSKAV